MKKTTLPAYLKQEATTLGSSAFTADKKRIPAHDARLMQMVQDNKGMAIPLMTAWLKAWDKANLSAPVPPPKPPKTLEEIKAQIAANRANPLAGTYDGLASHEIGKYSSMLMFGEDGAGYPGDEAWSQIAD